MRVFAHKRTHPYFRLARPLERFASLVTPGRLVGVVDTGVGGGVGGAGRDGGKGSAGIGLRALVTAAI